MLELGVAAATIVISSQIDFSPLYDKYFEKSGNILR